MMQLAAMLVDEPCWLSISPGRITMHHAALR